MKINWLIGSFGLSTNKMTLLNMLRLGKLWSHFSLLTKRLIEKIFCRLFFSFDNYLLLHDHDHLWACVVGGQTLDQFWMVETVHQFNLLAGCRLLLGGPGSVELPCTLLTRLSVGQPEHLAKLPTGNFKEKKSVWSVMFVSHPSGKFKNMIWSLVNNIFRIEIWF